MSGRPASDPFGWGYQQAVPPQHGGQFTNDHSTMQQQTSLHQLNRPASSSYRDHPLPSPASSGYAPSYLQSRPPPSANASLNYGMPPSMSGNHVHDSAAAPSSAYPSQPQYGGAAMTSGFQYGSQGFYGAPQPPQHPDTMAQQHQQYYVSHHPSSGAPTMDSNAHGHPMYGGNAAHMDPSVVGHNDQFHGEAGMMGSTSPYAGLQGIGIRPKRKQVKNACVNCQKACKKCDEGRPCGRCVKYGLADTCQDSARKERRRGVKRGPYKRRATTGSQPSTSGAISMPGGGNGAASYSRDGHIANGGRSIDGVSSAPEETQLSSPGFGGQMVPPRPPFPMGMQSNVSASWQSTSSPSLRSVDDDRDARFGRNIGGGGGAPPLGQNSYYGYDSQDGGPSPYNRSSSAPIPGPGSLVLSPIGSLSRLQPTPGFSQGPSGHQLPSLMMGASLSGNLNAFYANGANRPLISPSLHSGPSAGFLNPALGSAPQSHSRLHSDGSFGGSLNSASASASTMSPRTPMHSGQGSADFQMSPPKNGGKFPTSYVPPQPTVPTGAGTFLSQDQSRPFPLKMPKALQRNHSGTASSFLEAQASRSRMDYESSHSDNSNNGSNLAPICREPSPAGQRSSLYMGGSGHRLHGAADDAASRRMGSGSGLTPRIELSSYPTPMSMSSGAGGMAKREADVPGSLGLA